MKKILVLSHCILNTASKVQVDESELAHEYELRRELLQLIIRENIQLLQLPCPEFMLYGSQRWGHVRDQFDNPFYKSGSKQMLEPFLMQLEEYHNHPELFELLGIVSVEGSPSCGYKLTCTSDQWCGEMGSDPKRIEGIQNSLEMKPGPGMFMKILLKELQVRDLEIPVFTMEEAIKRIDGGIVKYEE